MEGANVINLDVGNTWRYLTVDEELKWVDLGVLGGNAIATVQNTGLVKSTENTPGMIQVESDGTMSLIGWDTITSDIENLDLALGNLEESFNNHISDITTVNTTPHVSPSDRTKWNNASTTANNAIPKVTAAVNNNITLWSSGGVLKDSGKAFVTNFTTPTNNGIPTALAVNNLVTSAINTEVTNRNNAIDTKVNAEATTRSSADTALGNRITNEATPHTTGALTLTAGGWNSSKRQTITISGYNNAKLNTVVVDPGSAVAWANAGVNAIAENNNGITFQCSVVPSVSLTFRVVSENLVS